MIKKLPYKEGALLNRLHTYGIAAKARFLFEVTAESELKEAFLFIKENNLPFIAIGRGSNILFRNDYFDGVVLVNKMTNYSINETEVCAESGVNLPLLARKTAKLDLSGFEKLVGVPGTIGGAVCMNAGVGDLEISDLLISVEVMTNDGKIKSYNKDECGFKYRGSLFQSKNEFILRAFFKLEESKGVQASVQTYLKKRLVSQPIEERNSGCIFMNPDGEKSAGALIDECGLKGYSIGGAQISAKHANFINNTNDATYNDVMRLIEEIQKVVKEKKGVVLKHEVRII
jgi:UDP-N-acetylmuramate dehydrogenase